MEANNIKCPKCSSTQLYFDKKGFSGKKAVVGAVLTGGIGLLAGTLGSNKVMASCLACGNKFSPVKPKTFTNNIPSARIENIPTEPIIPITKTEYKIRCWIFTIITLFLFAFFCKDFIHHNFSFLDFLALFGSLIFGSLSYYSYQLSKPVTTS